MNTSQQRKGPPMAPSLPNKPQSAALRMADGGSFTQMFREKVFGAPKGYVPAAKANAPAPAPAPAQPPAKAITDYSSGSATQRRMTEVGSPGTELEFAL